jgi:hypothetical protein
MKRITLLVLVLFMPVFAAAQGGTAASAKETGAGSGSKVAANTPAKDRKSDSISIQRQNIGWSAADKESY